jgi:hypothetical protein
LPTSPWGIPQDFRAAEAGTRTAGRGYGPASPAFGAPSWRALRDDRDKGAAAPKTAPDMQGPRPHRRPGRS